MRKKRGRRPSRDTGRRPHAFPPAPRETRDALPPVSPVRDAGRRLWSPGLGPAARLGRAIGSSLSDLVLRCEGMVRGAPAALRRSACPGRGGSPRRIGPWGPRQRKAVWFCCGGSVPGRRHRSPASAALPGPGPCSLPGKPTKGNVGEWKCHSPRRGPPGQGKQSLVNHAGVRHRGEPLGVSVGENAEGGVK